jgi:hypothetical protein
VAIRVRGTIEAVDAWINEYRNSTPWVPEIVEIPLGALVYLFDHAPAAGTLDVPGAESRVVGVWGRVGAAATPRDRARQSGFLPDPARWSAAGYDRGHFVAHSLGGGMDINIFPQARHVNRGTSPEGRRWRGIERRLAGRCNALIFVRPIYASPGWIPARVEVATVVDGEVELDCFDNSPAPSG